MSQERWDGRVAQHSEDSEDREASERTERLRDQVVGTERGSGEGQRSGWKNIDYKPAKFSLPFVSLSNTEFPINLLRLLLLINVDSPPHTPVPVSDENVL